MPAPTRRLRGRCLRPCADARRFERIDDALIEVDAEGRVAAVAPAPAGCEVPETHPGCVLMPAFVDAHVHFPQTRVRGSASGPLLDWLQTTVFPEEARFADRAYAEAVAAEFTDELLAAGTTTAAVYSSPHPEATDALFEAFERAGLRGWIGLTLMDRGAPSENLLDADAAIAACEALADRWHGRDGRLFFCVTPRFALSCTPELLARAGELAARRGLPVQTHINENRVEIELTEDAFPEAEGYFDVYDRAGLLGPNTLLAHCIWQGPEAWARMAEAGCSAAHCPDSNFFLGSGCMKLQEALDHEVEVGLGTDVGAGRSFSLPHVAAKGYDASLIVEAPVSPEALLWLATLGGARAMGLEARVGALQPGQDADIVALRVPDYVTEAGLFDALCFRFGGPAVAATYARGALRYSSGGGSLSGSNTSITK